MSSELRLPLLDRIKGPLLFTGAFMTLLQQHFSVPEALFDETLRKIIWSPTDKHTQQTDTRIYIDNKLQPNPKQANFRPAILIHILPTV